MDENLNEGSVSIDPAPHLKLQGEHSACTSLLFQPLILSLDNRTYSTLTRQLEAIINEVFIQFKC